MPWARPIACPDRKVIALAGDGSAMYTIQALWTLAREKLDVISIVFNNRSYAILNVELQRVGAVGAGDKAKAQLDLKQSADRLCAHGRKHGRAIAPRHHDRRISRRLRARPAHAGAAPDRGHRAADPDRTEAARTAACAAIAGQPAAGRCAGDQARHCTLITTVSANPAIGAGAGHPQGVPPAALQCRTHTNILQGTSPACGNGNLVLHSLAGRRQDAHNDRTLTYPVSDA